MYLYKLEVESSKLSALRWEQAVRLFLPICFLHLYEADFVQELLRKHGKGEKKLAFL